MVKKRHEGHTCSTCRDPPPPVLELIFAGSAGWWPKEQPHAPKSQKGGGWEVLESPMMSPMSPCCGHLLPASCLAKGQVGRVVFPKKQAGIRINRVVESFWREPCPDGEVSV